MKKPNRKLSQKALLAAERRLLRKKREKTGGPEDERGPIGFSAVTGRLVRKDGSDEPAVDVKRHQRKLDNGPSAPRCGMSSKVETPIDGGVLDLKRRKADGYILAEHADGNGGYDKRMLRRYGFDCNERKRTTLYRGQLPFVGSCERTIEMPRRGKTTAIDFNGQCGHMAHMNAMFTGEVTRAELKRIYQDRYNALIDAEAAQMSRDASFHELMLHAAELVREADSIKAALREERNRKRREQAKRRKLEKAGHRLQKPQKKAIAVAGGDFHEAMMSLANSMAAVNHAEAVIARTKPLPKKKEKPEPEVFRFKISKQERAQIALLKSMRSNGKQKNPAKVKQHLSLLYGKKRTA